MKNHRTELARRRLDARFATLPSAKAFAVPPKGWIRAIREAVGMTAKQLGDRLGIRAQSVYEIETSEASGLIQLSTLRKAAAALDCTLVYALVPNTPLTELVRRRAHEIASRDLARIEHSMKLEGQGVERKGSKERIQRYIDESLRDRDLWDSE